MGLVRAGTAAEARGVGSQAHGGTVGLNVVTLRLPGEQIFRSNLDGGFDHVRVVVDLSLRREGTYSLAGNLSKEGHTVVSAGRGQVLTVGSHTVPLDFSGQTLARRGADGPYAGLVAWEFSGPLIWGQQVDGPYQVDVVVREAATGVERDRLRLSQLTQAYQHTDFDPANGGAAISLMGRSSNHGLDLNGNGRFNQLRVAVEVAVPGAAFYNWSARLEDAHGTEIGFFWTQGAKAQGVGTIEFVFDGQAIAANAVSGPYFVRGLLLFASGQGSLLVTDVAATDAYRYTQFEGAPAPGDTDGDGDIDRDDLALVVAGRGTAAQGPDDRRDLDGDGRITALDARKLVTLFTRPGGATR